MLTSIEIPCQNAAIPVDSLESGTCRRYTGEDEVSHMTVLNSITEKRKWEIIFKRIFVWKWKE